MARRRDPVEKWLEQAIGTDTTRPFLLSAAISADDENIRACSDGHRMHVTNAKLYTAEIKNEWQAPTDCMFKPKKGFKITKTFNRELLVLELEKLVNETLNNKLVEQIKTLNETAELFNLMKSLVYRDGFEESIKETLATLREYRNPKSQVSLEQWLGVDVHLNVMYLFEALNYPHGKIISLNNDGDELGPVIIEYLDTKLAACIMPMRH